MNSNSHPSSRNNKNLTNSTISSRSYDAMDLDKFPDFQSLSLYSNLSFCHNPITSFLTLPILPNLISLKLDFTKITSFNGANKQPQLSSISLTSTPISSYKYFFEMCLIAFGTQLIRINDKIVSSKQRKFARENNDILSKYICSGWLITKGGQPIHLLHYKTRKRICFYTYDHPSNQNPNETFNSEDQSNDNVYSQFSRSTTANNEQESTTTGTYASSFISDSSDISSSTTSINPYKLDEKTREDLLTKMINLSHEWNPPPKTKLSDRDKDNFLESSIFELFQPSMARNRRIVTRDQRPENLFKRPVSIQSESPYADERKSYLLRKKEEYERRMKQKQEELRKQQEEEEFEYEEEEEEEEIAEQEKVKNENEMHLQDNLQEEKIKDNDVHDTNDFNINNLEEEEEEKEEQNVVEQNEPPKQEKESTQTEEKVDNKPEIKQIQIKRKSIPSIAYSAKVITTPKENESQLVSAKSEKSIVTPQPKAQGDESRNTPLLSESEMEVFRKRRLMSMNKFILNPNSTKQNTENADAARNFDDKIVKKRRKTLIHARTVRDIEKPMIDSNSNNNSSANLTDSNNNLTPTKINKDKFTRRPTYSEIMSSRYKEQHKFNYPPQQQNKMVSTQKLQQTSQSSTKFSLTKRKTSFAALDINKFLEENSKEKTDTNKTENINENETENTEENKTENTKENEIENKTENIEENKTENTEENKTENTKENEIENKTENIEENKTENTEENKIENKTENIEENKTENIEENKTENIEENKTENTEENKIENKTESTKENETENTNENESKNEINLEKIKNEPETQEKDHNDNLMDDKINSFLEKQKSEEEDAEPDLELLEEMLKDVNVDDEDDL